jgi:hypothetical protein
MSSYETKGIACCKLPILLKVCPTCNGGIKQTRAFQWINIQPWLAGKTCDLGQPQCPAFDAQVFGDRVGLMWIGTQFYPNPATFIAEANRLGISRRIKAIPRGFKLGRDWVFLAHPKIHYIEESDKWIGGIFRIFKPEYFEKIITKQMSDDEEEMEKLEKKGIVPVVVPDDDMDHQGSVYDKEEENAELDLDGNGAAAQPPA